MTKPGDDIDEVVAAVGPRLRALRTERGTTLAALADTTGISVSTLSRLESGDRKPSLELLLPIARAHQIPLDELVSAPAVEDPRVKSTPVRREHVTILPLTRRPGGMQAYKMIVDPGRREPKPRVHEGYEWLYVLSGRLHLVLGRQEIGLGPGEVAEFDTRTPHVIANREDHPIEVLALFGPQGERMHVRSRSVR